MLETSCLSEGETDRAHRLTELQRLPGTYFSMQILLTGFPQKGVQFFIAAYFQQRGHIVMLNVTHIVLHYTFFLSLNRRF
jgi:hypothetical protein